MNSNSTKFIIVTGANKGIGFQLVKDLLKLESNYSVILTSRDIKRGQEAVKSIEDTHSVKGRLFYEQLDIESEESIKSFAEVIQKKYKSIYALVNNAAVSLEPCQKLEDFATCTLDEKSTKIQIQINVRGTIKITKAILPFLEEKGRVVFLSSFAGLQSFQGEELNKKFNNEKLTEKEYFEILDEFEAAASTREHHKLGYHNSIYIVTKYFVNNYVRALLKNHLKKGQTAFAVHPGIIKTDMNSMASISVEEGTVSSLRVLKFTEKEALEHNLQFFDDKGEPHAY